jgi:hypothetical protein
MVALRVWWLTQVPEAAKNLLAAIAGAATAFGLVGYAFDIPGRVDASESANLRQDGEIRDLQTGAVEAERNDVYLICLTEATAGIGGKTPIQCANDRIRGLP